MDRSNRVVLMVAGLLAVTTLAFADTAKDYAERVASLIDPAKLATLAERGANPRVQKYVAQLAEARAEQLNVSNIVVVAVARVGMKGEAATLTRDAMLRNLTIADRLGCLDTEGLKEMRQGKAATVKRGPYKGQELSVDHIIPFAIVPELDKVIANLELMPERVNKSKGYNVGERQLDLGWQLQKAGLLSKSGLKALKEKKKS